MAVVGLVASVAGGCAALAGLEDEYYVLEGAAGSGTSGGAGAGGAPGDVGGASGGAGDTGAHGGVGSGGSTGGDGGAGGGAECSADETKCSDNAPQRCVDGRWEEAEPCPAAAPVCSGVGCVTPPSCAGLAPTCGPASDESCCATGEAVPGGTFNRSNDTRYPATVSGFLLDRYEVTVARFRKFVEVYPGSKPAAGAGAHPGIEGSGWNAGWDSSLPVDSAGLKAAVKCDATYQTWTDGSGANEHLPMNCLSWYVAFAFCAWDGGRLATEAEWNYAAAGGGEQREYPWSQPPESTDIDSDHAVYDGASIAKVGSKSSAGDGRWGQTDLAGNLWEWNLDWYERPYPVAECNDCANIGSVSASRRGFCGGGFGNGASPLLSSHCGGLDPSRSYEHVGARCARTP